MINLLSIDDRQAVRAEYRHRLFILGSLLIFGLILISLIILGSFVFILSLRRDAVSGQIEATRQQFASTELEATRQLIGQANDAIKIINPTTDQELISAIWERLITLRGPGVRLNHLAFSSLGESQVAVNGQSQTRANLLAYLENLKRSGYFLRVESPIKNIIRERDITFSLLVTLAPAKIK